MLTLGVRTVLEKEDENGGMTEEDETVSTSLTCKARCGLKGN